MLLILIVALATVATVAGQSPARKDFDASSPACRQCANWSAPAASWERPLEMACAAKAVCQPTSACEQCTRLWCEGKLGSNLACGNSATPATPAFTFEPDTMRQGSDYRDFALRSAQPELCRDACASDPYCRSYGYVKPGAGSHGASPWCYLKNATPEPARNTCCIAGVKVAAPGAISFEPDTIRRGSDYRDFALPAAQPELCRDACAADAACRAYGYTKPGAGTHGASPWCYLKNGVPEPARNSCCATGVKSRN